MARPAHPLARRWLTLDGLRLHYREGGRPGDLLPPVVMVHGLVVSSRYLLPTAALLAPHLRVLVPDLPGFGRSEGPRPALDVAGLAAHLGRWLDALAVEAPLLVANSLGCQVVAELAAGSPRRWHGIVLTGPTVDRTRRTLPAQALRLLVDTLREPPKLAWIIATDALRAGPARVLRTTAAALRHRVEERLPHVAAPTLVLRGGRDVLCPQAWAEEVAALLPRGRLEVVRGAPHALNFAAPQALAERVLRFARDPAAGPAPS